MENNFKLKLNKKIRIAGKIRALTGLHIGGSNQGLEIGGVDNAIVRDPLTNQPYIPGSSYKGKIRSLLEKRNGITDVKEIIDPQNPENKIKKPEFTNEGVWQNPFKALPKLFGVPAEIAEKANEPTTRIIFRDSYLTEYSAKKLFKSDSTDAPYTEIKTEISVDRITAKATPRPVERVPRNAEFEFEIIINIFEKDKELESTYIKLIEQGLDLLNDDYLGGSGSRGSGRVRITIEKKEEKDLSSYEKDNDWKPYNFTKSE